MLINDGYVFIIFDILYSTHHPKNRRLDNFKLQLIKRGYRMVQYSFYKKYIRELKLVDYEIEAIKKIAPDGDRIQLIKMTTSQVENFIIPISGEKITSVFDKKTIVSY